MHGSVEVGDSLWLISVQLCSAVLISVPALFLLGACAGWVPVAGTLLSSFLVTLWWGARRPGFLTRPRIRRFAVHSGLAHALVVGLAYAGVYLAFPDAFEFSPSALLLLSPALGAAGGIVAMGLTLCAADGAAAALARW